jgi:hypothetical protein
MRSVWNRNDWLHSCVEWHSGGIRNGKVAFGWRAIIGGQASIRSSAVSRGRPGGVMNPIHSFTRGGEIGDLCFMAMSLCKTAPGIVMEKLGRQPGGSSRWVCFQALAGRNFVWTVSSVRTCAMAKKEHPKAPAPSMPPVPSFQKLSCSPLYIHQLQSS